MLRGRLTDWLEKHPDFPVLETSRETWSRARLLYDINGLDVDASRKPALALANGYDFLVRVLGLIFRDQAPLLLNPALPPEVRCELAERMGFSPVWDQPGFSLSGAVPPPAREEEKDPRQAVLHLLTSGTTGNPRMAARSAEAICNQCDHLVDAFHLKPGDRVLALPPFFHSYGIEAVVMNTLAAGATLVLPDAAPFGLSLAEAVDRSRVSHLFANPPLVKLLLAARRENPRILDTVRHLVSAGALLEERTAAEWHAEFGFHPSPVYGLTDVGCVAVSRGDHAVRNGYVGDLFPGFAARVDRPDGTEASPGETGIIWIRKPYLDLGYPLEPEWTAEVFRDGWFRTGDLGKVDDQGRVFLSGARSGRINVGGEKVDPGFVESEILRIPGVAECVVYAEPHAVFGQIVRAAVSGRGITSDDILDALRGRLDPVALPRRVDVSEKPLERNPGGKLSRHWFEEKALRKADF